MTSFSAGAVRIFGMAWLLGAGLSASAQAGWDQRLVRVADGHELSLSELSSALSAHRHVVLSEKHATAAVQSAQARAIRATVAAGDARGDFDLAWEFLNHTDTPRIDAAWTRVRAGELDAAGFLGAMGFHSSNLTYVPILESVRDLGGALLGVNLSRAEKAPVVRGGIGAADPALVPIGYERGGEGYWRRFLEAMQGHATPEQISNYFDAQCLTDDVMADQIVRRARGKLSFLVTGSFHADFRDGAVARLLHRDPGASIAVIRFVDAADYTEAQLPSVLKDPVYGDVADYVWFVNEPVRADGADPATRSAGNSVTLTSR